MSVSKKNYSAEFKARIALEAIKQELTQNQISAKYEVHSTQINNWRKQATDYIKQGFSNKVAREQQDKEALIDVSSPIFCYH